MKGNEKYMKGIYLILIILGFVLLLSLVFISLENSLEKDDLGLSFSVTDGLGIEREKILGIAVTEAEEIDYFDAFLIAKDAGMQVVELALDWNVTEINPGVYQDYNGFLAASDMFYHTQNVSLILSIGPIDTNRKTLPTYLQNKNFDNVQVIEAYKNMIDFVISQLPNTSVIALSIGNEVDLYLQNNDDWADYIEFFRQTSLYVKERYPGVKVGAKASLYGLISDERENLLTMNQHSDVVMTTYYPLNSDFTVRNPEVVSTDLNSLMSLYSREIYLSEVGYPTSPLIGGSEQKQADFISEIFYVWLNNPEKIKLVNFLWLHDISQEQRQLFAIQYETSNPNFLAYLESLGLRTREGLDKEGFLTLKELAVLLKCGNSVLETNEQCDDGNSANGDGCSSLCIGECVDSDYGNYYVRGTAGPDFSGQRYTDFCHTNQNSLMEYSCENKILTNSSYYCPYGCLDGACKSTSGSSSTPKAPSVRNPSTGSGAIQ